MKIPGWKIWVIVLVGIWTAVLAIPDGKLRIIVCNVGQGDAILITRGTEQMLIDGGPDNKVLGCLGRHIPFYDRRIEVVMLTHPEADHLTGLTDVVKSYSVMQFISPAVGKNTVVYEKLTKAVRDKQIPVKIVYAGDQIKFGGIKFDVVWPEKEWVEMQAVGKDEVNGYAIGGILKYGGFKMMFTGDADQQIEADELVNGRLEQVDVLKVPHHGSKTGMTKDWLEALRSKLAVISVGKNNYGHPTEEALKLLSDEEMKILRTDQEGDIEIITDGQKWSVK